MVHLVTTAGAQGQSRHRPTQIVGVVISGSRGWRWDRQPLTCLTRDSTRLKPIALALPDADGWIWDAPALCVEDGALRTAGIRITILT